MRNGESKKMRRKSAMMLMIARERDLELSMDLRKRRTLVVAKNKRNHSKIVTIISSNRM